MKYTHNLKNIKEIPPNKGWNDSDFQAVMRSLGWNTGWAWCAIFAKYLWDRFDIKTKDGRTYKDISVNCMQTFNKMKNIASKVPTSAGSLVVWQSKTNVTSGHIGVLVHNISEREIITLEGNTDADGTREGDGIYLKKRAFNSIGMNFKGFVPCASNAEFEAYIRESINLNDGTWQ